MNSEDTNPILRRLAERIRSRRKSLGISQEKLAEVAGLSTNYVARIELGMKVPTISTSSKLAEALGVQVADLVVDENSEWLDEAQGIAHLLRSLKPSDAKFAKTQFRALIDHLRQMREDC